MPVCVQPAGAGRLPVQVYAHLVCQKAVAAFGAQLTAAWSAGTPISHAGLAKQLTQLDVLPPTELALLLVLGQEYQE